MEIYLAGTKTHLADYASRSPVNWEQEILINPDSWESNWEVKVGSPCAKCSLHEIEDIPHPEYCDKKIKNIPDTLQPNLLQVLPSQPKNVKCEGKTITYRIGGVRLGSPVKIDFNEIFNAVFPLPLAREEHLLVRQPMYPTESDQLAFLIKNLDGDFISRAEKFFNKDTDSSNMTVARVEA